MAETRRGSGAVAPSARPEETRKSRISGCITENSCRSPSLTTQKPIGTKAMVEMSDAAVERLAKNLAEKDGFEWQLEFKQPLPPNTKPLLRPILDDAGRERYLTLAREQCDQGKRG
jgi:hypothetical protein